MTIMGLNFYGTEFFRSPSNSVNNIYYGELKNGIYDEIEIRERTDVGKTNIKDAWQIDHRAIFKFLNDLEGGNIQNSGLEIVSFAIKRRKASELNSITLHHLPFVNNQQIVYTDYTQPNEDLVYSIVPIAENNLEGKNVDVSVTSDFVGWWLVDKKCDSILGFDKAMESVGNVEATLNQGRVVIETLSKYPQVYYFDKEYESFSLSTVIIPSEFERSGKSYEKILNTFIKDHRPFLVKSDTGRAFVCDVSNPRLSSPLNTWKNYDYGVLTLDFVEVQSVDEYMAE
ncbi:hypothetical protein BC351_10585 [Paenibacillus ferrarius]|uniref:Uncharacterized protein n=1 Tax=Paenibacillus ferrarius TaxID=1469647 RepID=A0A1V4HA77_9BACL|nr:hypothetical protein [Paenibacillus ferrarius]OPH47627.1 hypothetical protein BC351_10585 [Paenibacillus ferrarius]